MFNVTNINQVMAVGSEQQNQQSSSTPKAKTYNEIRKRRALRLVVWLSGFLLSLVPLLAEPLHELLFSQEFLSSLYQAFCGCEILFLGVTLAVSALNDFLENNSGVWHIIWMVCTILFIILGSIVYGDLIIQRSNNILPDDNVVFVVNIVYLGVIFILGLSRYLTSIFGGSSNE